MHHTFLYISLPFFHDYDRKMLNFAFYGERKQVTTKFSGSFEISFTKCMRGRYNRTGDFLDELPNFCDRQIFAIGEHFNCTILLFRK